MASQTLDPGTGEQYLTDLPQYGGKGGSSQAAQFYAGRDFAQVFGRNPTASELAMLAPAYMSGDPNIANESGGKAAIAQYFGTLSNTPANYYARQQTQWGQAAPQHYDAVNQVVQSLLGRSATQDELSHYGTLLASGQADPYEIGQFIQSLPEYQNAQDTKFRQGLDTQLQQSDQNFFDRTKGSIAQQYALMGRPTSPALDIALTDLSAQLSQNRQNYLAQLSANQYGGNKDAAMANYGTTQNNVLGRINQNSTAQYGNYQNLLQRTNDINDYNLQAQNYGNLMSRYNNRQPNALDYLNFGLNTVNAGANVARSIPSSGGFGPMPYGMV